MAIRIKPTQKAFDAVPAPGKGEKPTLIRVDGGYQGLEINKGQNGNTFLMRISVQNKRITQTVYKGNSLRTGLKLFQEAKEQAQNGQLKESVQGTYGDLAEKYVTSHIEKLKDAKGAKSKLKRLMALPLPDGRRVFKLDPLELMVKQTHVLVLEAALEKFKAPSTVNGIMSAHSRNLTIFEEKGLLEENLCRKLKRPKVNNRRSRKPTPVEITAHIRKARALGTPQALCQVLQAALGCRPSDARSARWSYVSSDGTTLIIPDSKNGEPAIYVINSFAADILNECRQWQVDDFVFPSDKRAEGYIAPPRALFESIRAEVMAEVGTEGVLPPYWQHDFRRAFASTCNAKHGDIRLTQQMLNHKSVTTTERYTFHVPNQLIEASERTAQALFGDLYNEITAV